MKIYYNLIKIISKYNSNMYLIILLIIIYILYLDKYNNI